MIPPTTSSRCTNSPVSPLSPKTPVARTLSFDELSPLPNKPHKISTLTHTLPKERDLLTYLLFMRAHPLLSLATAGLLPPVEKSAAFRALVRISERLLTVKPDCAETMRKLEPLERTLRFLSSFSSPETPPIEHTEAEDFLSEHFYELFLRGVPDLPECPAFFDLIARFYGSCEISAILSHLLIKNSSQQPDERIQNVSKSLLPSSPPLEPHHPDPILAREVRELKETCAYQNLSQNLLSLILRCFAGTLSKDENKIAQHTFSVHLTEYIQRKRETGWKEPLAIPNTFLPVMRQAAQALKSPLPFAPNQALSIDAPKQYSLFSSFTMFCDLVEQFFHQKAQKERIIPFFIFLLERTFPLQPQVSPNAELRSETTPLRDVPAKPDLKTHEKVVTSHPCVPLMDPPKDPIHATPQSTSPPSSSAFTISSPPLLCSKQVPHHSQKPSRKERECEAWKTAVSQGTLEFMNLSYLIGKGSDSPIEQSSSREHSCSDGKLPNEDILIPFLYLYEDCHPLSVSALLGTLDPIQKTAIVLATSLVILELRTSSPSPAFDSLQRKVNTWLILHLNLSFESSKDVLYDALHLKIQRSPSGKENMSSFFYNQLRFKLLRRINTFYTHYPEEYPEAYLLVLSQLFERNIAHQEWI